MKEKQAAAQNRRSFTDYSYFKDVSKLQKNLTKKEEEKLFKEYTELNKRFKLSLLSNKEAVQVLLNTIESLQKNGKSIAKLNAKFDNKKPGHNQNITKVMTEKLTNVDMGTGVSDQLYGLDFSNETYNDLFNTIVDLIPTQKKEELLKLREEIKQVETKLTCSALMMAIGIAQKYTSHIFNVDIKDAIQEATIGVYKAIGLYNPSYQTKAGGKVKFTTYANIKAEKRVKEKIMETSRLIKLPKSRLNVLFTVLGASSNLENPSISVIAQKSNEMLEKRKKRLLKPSEVITEPMVEEAVMLLNNNCIMLDTPIHSDKDTPGDIKTFGDIIPDNAPTAEDCIVLQDSRDELFAFLRENLDAVSEVIIRTRYFYDPPMSHEETADYLYKYGFIKKKLGKEAIRKKETVAISKLSAQNIDKLKAILIENINLKSKLEDQ